MFFFYDVFEVVTFERRWRELKRVRRVMRGFYKKRVWSLGVVVVVVWYRERKTWW